MDFTKLACGDSHSNEVEEQVSPKADKEIEPDQDSVNHIEDVTVQAIEDNETKLKDRISQCKNIIDCLKSELNSEKAKLVKETRVQQQPPYVPSESLSVANFLDSPSFSELSLSYDTSKYSASVDSKLTYDENLMEYEKQLQKYQNTLNLAQMEKKNAIRKQMLAKAYRLKLLEVENQCNIELLRVKQSLQCLEPLQMIVNKWKTSSEEDSYDLDNFELMPRYPELGPIQSAMAEISVKDEMEDKSEDKLDVANTDV